MPREVCEGSVLPQVRQYRSCALAEPDTKLVTNGGDPPGPGGQSVAVDSVAGPTPVLAGYNPGVGAQAPRRRGG